MTYDEMKNILSGIPLFVMRMRFGFFTAYGYHIDHIISEIGNVKVTLHDPSKSDKDVSISNKASYSHFMNELSQLAGLDVSTMEILILSNRKAT